jgi:hypothetical protein
MKKEGGKRPIFPKDGRFTDRTEKDDRDRVAYVRHKNETLKGTIF